MKHRRILLQLVATLVIGSGGSYLHAQQVTVTVWACCSSWWHTCCGDVCNATIFGCNSSKIPK